MSSHVSQTKPWATSDAYTDIFNELPVAGWT